MPELRKDPVVGRWVIISTERSRRPGHFTPEASNGAQAFSPFTEGREDMTPAEVYAERPNGSKRDTPGWLVRVVPNKFPALEIEGSLDRRGEGLYDKMNGIGAHEVVIETSDPALQLADLPPEQIRRVLVAWKERMLDLKKDTRFRYVLVFKNHGAGAGATLEHSHSQIIATPIIPKMVQEELDGARRYFELKERPVFSDIIDQETGEGQGRRVILRTGRYIVLAPFAPRFPFETWILPVARRAAFHTIEDPDEMLGAGDHAQGDARAPERGAGFAALQPGAAHGAARRAGRALLPLAPGDHAQAHPRRRFRDRLGLLHQPHAARGRRAVPARRGRARLIPPGA
jgi:UDPglucose--hexose-1-phosphate uridylyltransferase